MKKNVRNSRLSIREISTTFLIVEEDNVNGCAIIFPDELEIEFGDSTLFNVNQYRLSHQSITTDRLTVKDKEIVGGGKTLFVSRLYFGERRVA